MIIESGGAIIGSSSKNLTLEMVLSLAQDRVCSNFRFNKEYKLHVCIAVFLRLYFGLISRWMPFQNRCSPKLSHL